MAGGHGHGGHGADGDEIVLHQENLKGVFLVAFIFALITVFGLSQAGGTKLSILMGKDAYDKVQAQMPKIENKEHENKGEKTEEAKQTEHNVTSQEPKAEVKH